MLNKRKTITILNQAKKIRLQKTSVSPTAKQHFTLAKRLLSKKKRINTDVSQLCDRNCEIQAVDILRTALGN